MATAKGRRKRARGSIVTLPSGALRARVYAGYDPVTGKRHYLDEVISPGPRAQQEAERALTRFLSQVDERRNSKTRAPRPRTVLTTRPPGPWSTSCSIAIWKS